MRASVFLMLLAAAGCSPEAGPHKKHRPDTTGGTTTGAPGGTTTGAPGGTIGGTTTTTGVWTTQFDCTSRPPPPYQMTEYPIATEEDFSFDMDGHLVYQQWNSILGADATGNAGVLATGAPGDPAGLDVISDHDLLIAGPDTGTMRLMDLDTGGGTTLLTGLTTPNSVLGGLDGLRYVSELNLGRVRWLDPATGISGSVAGGLGIANGIALSPDEQTIYIAGDDTVWAVERDPVTGIWDPDSIWPLHNDPTRTFFTLDVDYCGWVYTVGYSDGRVLRISPDGANVEMLAQLQAPGWSFWGGMNFGNGVGDWARDTVYFTNRSVVKGVAVGIPGARGPNIPPP